MTIRERENKAKSAEFAKAVKQYEQAKQDIMDEGKDTFLAVLNRFADGEFHTAREMANWTVRGLEQPLSTKEIAANLYAMSVRKPWGDSSRYKIFVRTSKRAQVNTWVLLDKKGNPTAITKKIKGSLEYLINEIQC